ncbi:hypothetical protein IIV31_162L [Armadillidium vulgare iridescent virus]|uniref:Uncharacterized protein n=1 Tax=Armadillidium vulgare iridescent virus TaxID=72201 RepID=A0A068QLR4_9VIRU|nr:hypothetical protein IIV31_162L [Armadillidium vulgare iridescent virus]CCV02534.1 hypothetical protein IIV31_162L [Armadillidium vulgare iridescent virus]
MSSFFSFLKLKSTISFLQPYANTSLSLETTAATVPSFSKKAQRASASIGACKTGTCRIFSKSFSLS